MVLLIGHIPKAVLVSNTGVDENIDLKSSLPQLGHRVTRFHLLSTYGPPLKLFGTVQKKKVVEGLTFEYKFNTLLSF